VVLLEHLPDYYALGQPGVGSGSDGNVGRFRLAEHPSVHELLRCLLVLKHAQPVTHSHLVRFFMAETRVARVRRRRDVPVELRQSAVYEPRSRCYCFRERVLSAAVELERVERGVVFVVDEFELEPFVPRELVG